MEKLWYSDCCRYERQYTSYSNYGSYKEEHTDCSLYVMMNELKLMQGDNTYSSLCKETIREYTYGSRC